MKMYEFPYGGSGGKGDTWEGAVDVELSDRDYARLKASAKEGYELLFEDSEIEDIYQRVYEKIVDTTLQDLSDMIDEYREDMDCDEDATDREVIEAYLDRQCCRLYYPEELQDISEEDEEEEE